MAETYPQRVAVVRGDNVIATVTVDSDGDRQSYSENFGTAVFSMEEAKTLGLPQKLRLEIVDALGASQDAADLAETGRRLMAKRLNGSGGAPDLGGPPAQLPPEPTLKREESPRELLERGCALYCSWYDTGQPPMDGAGMAYELVSFMRQSLAGMTADV